MQKLNLGSMDKANETMASGYLEQQMLLAMPGMVDSNFVGSVTLMCQHNEAGAIGITINRLSNFTLGEIFSQLNLDCGSEQIRNLPVLEGGPVAPDRGFVLHSPKPGYESSMPVGSDIMVTTSRDVLADIAAESGPEKYLVALGYAGWGGGQLEGEMLANAWLSVSADTDIVFDLPLPNRFDEALGRLGINIERLHSDAGHA
ncbi:MAG: YqgE/AlgH family protein [Xanthomonadales bacterium]|nr:YqgE/AlgH family protein [Xanthomonadales bacterium]MDH3926123.1 YqgE/AlgH family protein [Xanthomonadales bacterium]MDH3941765.1 YqgE/AlgH family protein [Xanthomonadales bacterium]MDH3999873.1 YqgE/AlgH family protein [Xanthomonadales bacterium]